MKHFIPDFFILKTTYFRQKKRVPAAEAFYCGNAFCFCCVRYALFFLLLEDHASKRRQIDFDGIGTTVPFFLFGLNTAKVPFPGSSITFRIGIKDFRPESFCGNTDTIGALDRREIASDHPCRFRIRALAKIGQNRVFAVIGICSNTSTTKACGVPFAI